MDEKTALKRLKNRDEEALKWFIHRYGGYVYTVITGILGPDGDAEELSSDVFFALWQKAEQLRGDNVKAWLAVVARNLAKKHLSTLGRELSLDDDPTLTAPDNVERQVQRQEQSRLVNQALLAMSQPDREIFYRYYFYGQPIRDIALAVALHPAAVKTRLHRGRKLLKYYLEQGGFVYEAEDQ